MQEPPTKEKSVREASFSKSGSAAGEFAGETNGFSAGAEGVPAGEAPTAEETVAAGETEAPELTEAADITYDEQFYPARPKALRPIARRRQFFASRPSLEFDGRNAAYVEWLRNQAILGDANVMSRQLSGQASMWQNSY